MPTSLKHHVLRALWNGPRSERELCLLLGSSPEELSVCVCDLHRGGEVYKDVVEGELVWCSVSWFVRTNRRRLFGLVNRLVRVDSFDLKEEGFSWALYTALNCLRRYDVCRSNKLLAVVYRGVFRWLCRHLKRFWLRSVRERCVFDYGSVVGQRVGSVGVGCGELENEELIRGALSVLNDTERDVVLSVFWDGLTFREVGERLGCSREWARVVYNRALVKMREYCESCGVTKEDV
mgnify:CR=1 FL=1